ncbi:hypothetical protein MMC10_009462 [Thelotrema lepadinum]|nr:hypothetical protein [Thelotrema lepadinum]
MQCGAVCIEFAILRQACHTVEAFGLAPSLASTGKEDDLVRHMGRLQDYVRNNPSHHDLKLFSLLSARRSCLATDPRDKVFALIGLANDAQDLSPDYSKSVKEVYSQTAEHILYVNNNIGLLNEVKSLQLGSELPSWVPDWSVCPKVMLLASTNSNGTKRYRASGTSYPSFTIATKEKLLSIRGVSFDKVSQHLGRYSTISEGKNYVPEIGLIDYRTGLWAEMARSVYPDGIYGPTKEPLVQVYDRVLTCDQSIVSKRLDREAETAYYPETLAFIDAIRSENEHPLFPQAFKRMKDLDIDLEAAIKNNTRGPEIYAMEDVVKYLDRLPGMEDVIENIPEDVFRYVLSELTSAKIAFTEGRRLFISVSGHMGLCPSATEPEDVICILFGADIPFVLRPLQNGNYLLVGECYIDGFMDGEGLLQIVEGPGLGGLSEKLRASTQEFVLQ